MIITETSRSNSTQSLLTPWTVVLQAALSMEFSRQEYWSGQSFPSPEDLPNPGIKPKSPALHIDSLLSKPIASLIRAESHDS